MKMHTAKFKVGDLVRRTVRKGIDNPDKWRKGVEYILTPGIITAVRGPNQIKPIYEITWIVGGQPTLRIMTETLLERVK
jgi:hypothetical protein